MVHTTTSARSTPNYLALQHSPSEGDLDLEGAYLHRHPGYITAEQRESLISDNDSGIDDDDLGDQQTYPPHLPLRGDASDKDDFFRASPLNLQGFHVTLRHMNYRSFRRRFLGTHRERWSPGLCSGLFLLAGMLSVLLHSTACDIAPAPGNVSFHVSRHATSTYTHLATVLTLFFWCLLTARTAQVNNLLVLLNGAVLIGTLVALVCVLVLDSGSKNTSKARYLSSIRPHSTFWSANCPSQKTVGYYLYGLWGIIVALLLFDLIVWKIIIYRIGRWYYLKSQWFLKDWTLITAKPANVLCPSRKKAKRTLVINPNDSYEAQRFQVVKGVTLEWKADFILARLTRKLHGLFSWPCLRRKARNISPQTQRAQHARVRYPWTATYIGDVDRAGRPHGFGFWNGDLYHGETLVGFWNHGRPRGPYKSREISTGSGIMCLRIAWARVQYSDDPNKKLTFGVCDVACSVSGRFFKIYPEATFFQAPFVKLARPPVFAGARRRLEHLVQRTKKVVVNPFINGTVGGNNPSSVRGASSLNNLYSITTGPDTIADANRSLVMLPSTSGPIDKSRDGGNVYAPYKSQRLSVAGNTRRTVWVEKRHSLPLRASNTSSVSWVFRSMQPHTPSFGIQPRSEISVSVDRDTGIDIRGFVPLQQIFIERRKGGEQWDTEGCRAHPLPTSQNASRRELKVVASAKACLKIETAGSTEVKQVDLFAPELCIEGWASLEAIGISEVLLYVHGYNNDVNESAMTLGQMAAFGNFPPHIVMMLFSWPAGRGLSSFWTARSNAEQPAGHVALKKTLIALRNSGTRQIHILCHSMGARLFLKALRDVINSEDILAKCPRDDGDEQTFDYLKGRLQIITTTFLNPEYYLDEFVRIDYILLREYCSHITIYADGNDKALWWCEFFSRRETLGRSVFGLRWHRPTSTMIPQIQPEAPTGDLEQDSSSSTEKDCAFPTKIDSNTDVCPHLRPPPEGVLQTDGEKAVPRLHFMHTVSFFRVDDDLNDAEDKTRQSPNESLSESSTTMRHSRTSSCWRCHRHHSRLRNEESSSIERRGNWLDVDIIDTTFMEQNVHGMRHSFWSLNREVIEDLRELLTTRKRARQRTGRLDRRDGNVWVFRVAPSCLTSIFEV